MVGNKCFDEKSGAILIVDRCNQRDRKVYAIKVMKKSELVQKNLVSQAIAERNAMAINRCHMLTFFFFVTEAAAK